MTEKDKNNRTLLLVTVVFLLFFLLFCLHLWQTYDETRLMTEPQNTSPKVTRIAPESKLPKVLLDESEQENLLNLNPFKITALSPKATIESTKPVRRQIPQPPRNPQSHNMRLVGTIYGGKGWAALLDTKLNIEGFYSPGDTVNEDVKLISITRSTATIEFNGEEEILNINWANNINPTDVNSHNQASNGLPGVIPPPIIGATDGTSQSIEISSEDLKNNFKNLSHLLSQMRVQAYFEKGQPAGFLISKVRDDSFVAKLGAKTGDIIRSVNGDKVDSVQKAFKLYNSFKNNTSLDMMITRDGKPLTLNFSVR
jgi:general secretion pathway protein C